MLRCYVQASDEPYTSSWSPSHSLGMHREKGVKNRGYKEKTLRLSIQISEYCIRSQHANNN